MTPILLIRKAGRFLKSRITRNYTDWTLKSACTFKRRGNGDFFVHELHEFTRNISFLSPSGGAGGGLSNRELHGFTRLPAAGRNGYFGALHLIFVGCFVFYKYYAALPLRFKVR
jgi:hypothetical protein